jgi:hypothetical protein
MDSILLLLVMASNSFDRPGRREAAPCAFSAFKNNPIYFYIASRTRVR